MINKKALKSINTLLIFTTVFLGLKQGYDMVIGKQEMLAFFGKWNFNKIAVLFFGIYMIIAAILILFSKTFIEGNFLMVGGILLMMCYHIIDYDLKNFFKLFVFFFIAEFDFIVLTPNS